MYVSDTEDDDKVGCPYTRDHVLDVSAEALSKVYLRLVFKLVLTLTIIHVVYYWRYKGKRGYFVY